MAAKFPLLLGAVLAILLLVSQDVAHADENGQLPPGYGPYTNPGWGGSTPYHPPEKDSTGGGGQNGDKGSGSYP